MKYYWKERWTVQAGLGFFGWPSGGGVHLDLLHEWPDAIDTSTRDFKLPLFLGMGLKSGEFAYCRNAGIGNDCFSRGVAALRLPMGMAIQLDHEPIELAAEFAPSIYTHFDNVGWEGDLALHVRYFY